MADGDRYNTKAEKESDTSGAPRPHSSSLGSFSTSLFGGMASGGDSATTATDNTKKSYSFSSIKLSNIPEVLNFTPWKRPSKDK